MSAFLMSLSKSLWFPPWGIGPCLYQYHQRTPRRPLFQIVLGLMCPGKPSGGGESQNDLEQLLSTALNCSQQLSAAPAIQACPPFVQDIASICTKREEGSVSSSVSCWTLESVRGEAAFPYGWACNFNRDGFARGFPYGLTTDCKLPAAHLF